MWTSTTTIARKKQSVAGRTQSLGMRGQPRCWTTEKCLAGDTGMDLSPQRSMGTLLEWRIMHPSDDDWRQPARFAKRAAEEADIRGAECTSNEREDRASQVSTPFSGASSMFTKALRVVLLEQDRGGWLESVRELQRSSLEVCKDCREIVSFRLRVTDVTPRHLWNARVRKSKNSTFAAVVIPPVRVTGITWVGRDPDEPPSLPPDLEDISYGPEVKRPLWGVAWPRGVKRITLSASWTPPSGRSGGCNWPPSLEELKIGDCFDTDRDPRRLLSRPYFRPHGEVLTPTPVSFRAMLLPSTLRYISFGNDFNCAVEGVAWPEGLKRISFGGRFDGAIEGTRFPRGLEEIYFGEKFNQPVERVNWPPALKKLSFGHDFNQPLSEVSFPGGLEQLLLDGSFDQPIDRVTWPEGLKRLAFGFRFDQPMVDVSLPAGLRELVFGLSFNHPVDRMVWPRDLRRLIFGARFDQVVPCLPPALEQLVFGYTFNQSVARVAWPKTLRRLTFGHDFDQEIEGVVWPKTLRRLTFGHDFDQEIEGVVWPTLLRCIVFGYCFNHPINRAEWPAALEQLTFGGCFDHPIDGVSWPYSFRRLTLGYAFTQSLERVRWPPRLAYLSLDSLSQASRGRLPDGVKIELT